MAEAASGAVEDATAATVAVSTPTGSGTASIESMPVGKADDETRAPSSTVEKVGVAKAEGTAPPASAPPSATPPAEDGLGDLPAGPKEAASAGAAPAVARPKLTNQALSDFDVGVTLGTGSFGRVYFATHKVRPGERISLAPCITQPDLPQATQSHWAVKAIKKAEAIKLREVRRHARRKCRISK